MNVNVLNICIQLSYNNGKKKSYHIYEQFPNPMFQEAMTIYNIHLEPTHIYKVKQIKQNYGLSSQFNVVGAKKQIQKYKKTFGIHVCDL